MSSSATGAPRAGAPPSPDGSRTRPAPVLAPTQLPVRYDGRPITHLSHSSHTLWVMCPEAWRRRYVLGETTAATPGKFLGTAVDRALTRLAEARIAGQQPERGDVLRFYDDGFEPALAEQPQGVAWTPAEPLEQVRAEGRKAVALAFEHLVP